MKLAIGKLDLGFLSKSVRTKFPIQDGFEFPVLFGEWDVIIEAVATPSNTDGKRSVLRLDFITAEMLGVNDVNLADGIPLSPFSNSTKYSWLHLPSYLYRNDVS